MHIVLLCATNRGLRFLKALVGLCPSYRITVMSFCEEVGEPPFFDAIRDAATQAGHQFIEARATGSEKLKSFWSGTPVDLLFAVSWRYMVPPQVYRQARLGSFVFHDSLLPRYRGFSPTVWSIVNGEDHTGVTLFEMADAVDYGPIVDQYPVPIGSDDRIDQVLERVTQAYLAMLERNIAALSEGRTTRRPQDHTAATYCSRRIEADNRIDWTLPSVRIYDLVRALAKPYPGAFTAVGNRKLRVWSAARWLECRQSRRGRPGSVVELLPGEGALVLTGDGTLLLTDVQFEGQEVVCAAEVLTVGTTLGTELYMDVTGITIPFNRSSLVGDELTFVTQSLQSGRTSGDQQFTKKCQQLMQTQLDVPRVLLTTSCTHALEMSAILLDIDAGDEVIVPSFTFVSTANAFALRGATIVFADVRPDTLNLDESGLEALISPRTKAIVVVHYAGVACEMEAIMEVADRYGIAVVEDNAHGLFGKYKGRNLGSFGCLATQSFHETKNISCGEGGALLINDESLVERAEIIREKGTNRSRFFRGQVDKYTWVDIGSSYVLSDILAAVLYGQLSNAEKVQAGRRSTWDAYHAQLADWAAQNDVVLPTVPSHCEQSYHMYYLLLPSLEARTELIAWLRQRGILPVFHYVPLHRSEMGRKFGGRPGDCPVTESVSDRLLRLPLFFGLSESEQSRVIDSIREFSTSAVQTAFSRRKAA